MTHLARAVAWRRQTVLTVGAVLGVVCLLLAAGSALFGLRPLVFRSGSMSPTIDTGALGLAREVDAARLRGGGRGLRADGRRRTGDAPDRPGDPPRRDRDAGAARRRRRGAGRARVRRRERRPGPAGRPAAGVRRQLGRGSGGTVPARALRGVPALGAAAPGEPRPTRAAGPGTTQAATIPRRTARPGPARGRPPSRTALRPGAVGRGAVVVALGVLVAGLAPLPLTPTLAAWSDTAAVGGSGFGVGLPAPSGPTCAPGKGKRTLFTWGAVGANAGAGYVVHYGTGGALTATIEAARRSASRPRTTGSRDLVGGGRQASATPSGPPPTAPARATRRVSADGSGPTPRLLPCPPPPSASSPSRATSASTCACSTASGVARARRTPAGGARGLRRAGHPRRRVDHDGQAGPDLRAVRAAAEADRATGMPAFGTCAGMILLADRIEDGTADQETLGGLDITVRRNAFGRQVDSFEGDLDFAGLDDPVHAVFIRAPWVEAGRRRRRGARPRRARARPRVGSSRSGRAR